MSSDTQGWEERLTMDGVPYYHNSITEEVTWDKPDALKSNDELCNDSGRWRWIPDEEYAWVAGRELERFDDGSAECEVDSTGEIVVVPASSPDWPLLKSSLMHLEEDLVLVDNMNEGLIIHNLRERFKQNKIYTNIGTILISVNPFKRLPLYTPSMMDKYYHSGGNKRLPPHIFGIADAAYKSMFFDKLNQSILISGESGAGKTEATKQCLAFFAEVAGSESNVEQKIIQANPILEAFGNAKTVRNNNSSRFGKYMEIHFDSNGIIIGARTENYLLEKSRVVYQAEGERNFHIFYQLVKGSLAEKYGVDEPIENFQYLNNSGCFDADDIDDVEEFNEVLESFDIIGFNEDEKDWLFKIIAAILKLGNLEFEGTSDESGSIIKNPKLVEEISILLDVNEDKLAESVLSRWFVIRGQEPTKIPFKPHEAKDACDALAKAIYGEVFNWLVKRINQSVEVKKGNTKNFIGVLDIFGFEIFESNSFEQLCINFANEKLQQHFNQYTFKLEEKVYQTEKINFNHIEFIDNQPILDMIEKKPSGLLVLLDEEIVMPKGSDETWCRKIFQTHGSSNHFEKIIKKDTAFIINHYAGAVTYDADGFLVKNKDTLYQDLYDVVSSSKELKLSSLFPKTSNDDKNNSKRKKQSLGGQFRQQLSDLMIKLNQTHPHYVRCVKPNSEKSPNNFQSVMSLEQLRYAGVFEAISIRQQGFPFRYSHTEFVRRYKCLALKDDGWIDLKSKNNKEMCKELLDITKQDFSTVQIGRTQVLYRAPQQRILELLRNLALERVCVIAQSYIRTILTQIFARRMKKVRPNLIDALNSIHDLEKVENELAYANEEIGSVVRVFNFQMHEITLCKILREKLVERKRVTELLQKIYPLDPEVNFDKLSDAVKQGDDIIEYPGNPDQIKLYKDAKAKLELTIERRKIRAELNDATEKAEKQRLIDGINRANELGIPNCDEVNNGKKMIERIEKEENVIRDIESSLSNGGITLWSENAQSLLSIENLDKSISEAIKFGMKTAEGKKLLEIAKFCKKLRNTLKSVEWNGSSQWISIECLYLSDDDDDDENDENNNNGFDKDLLSHEEVSWSYYETKLRNRIREVLDPLEIAVQTMNQKIMKKTLASFKEPPKLGNDQLRRLKEKEDELSITANQALEAVQTCKQLLNDSINNDDENDLIEAINYGEEIGISDEIACHLLEKFAMAKLLLAMKFHIPEGCRGEVGLLLDEAMAGATSTVIEGEEGEQVELGKEAILEELNTQLYSIHGALEFASNVVFESEKGKHIYRQGEVSFTLRQALLSLDWDEVEQQVNHANSLQMNGPDVQLARDEIIGRAAAEDVLQKITDAINDISTPSEEDGHPSEGILQTCLAQAERLQMKELEHITMGRDLYNTIVQARAYLQNALNVSAYDDFITLAEEYNALYDMIGQSCQLLTDSINYANEFGYRTSEVDAAEHLLYELTILNNIQVGLQTGGYLSGNQPTDIPANFIEIDALNEAYAPTDGFELTMELSQYIVTKAYHIICIRGAIQILAQDHSHLEDAITEANGGIGFDTPELLSAKELIEIIHDVIGRMEIAEEKVEQFLLEDAVQAAEQYFYENENVERVRNLRDRVIELNEESRNALWNFDKKRMESVYESANEIRLTTPHFERIGGYLDFSEEDFLKLEIKKAKEIGDEDRKIRISIRLKELTLDNFGKMFTVLQFKSLRTGKDFASQKLVTTDRKKLAMGMMYWTKTPIHTSLTDIEDPQILKLAKRSFKNILGFMMDKKYPYPSTLAQELIQNGIDNPGLRSEIYCQIIKQLTEHPVPSNKQRGYQLLAICCANFPPSPDFENYLEMYLRDLPERSSKYIAVLRDVQYGPPKTTAPDPDAVDSFISSFFSGDSTGISKYCEEKSLKTASYPQEFMEDPEKLFLETEIELI